MMETNNFMQNTKVGNPGSIDARAALARKLWSYGFYTVAQKDGVLVEYRRIHPKNDSGALLSDIIRFIGEDFIFQTTFSGKILVNFK